MARELFRRTSALVLSAVLTAASASALPPGSTPREIELGRQAAEDIGKSIVLVEDKGTLAKLEAMLEEIAAVTDRPEIRYQPHIVASPLPNAFVVPGGWVYVTTGMLDAVESDDELAGVLAHEIAHNVNQHAIERMRNSPKGLGLLQLASIAALIIGKSPEAAVLAGAAANHITASVLHGNSVAAEVEADAHGIDYMTRTSYDPTGFLTIWERFAISAGKFFEEELGVYATHPLTRDRVHAARDRLEELGVPILRRLVTDAPQPESRTLVVDGEDVTEIRYRSERLALLAGHDPDRAAAAVATMAWILDYELDESRIKVIPARDGVVFQPEGGPPFSFSHADGRVNHEGEAVLAGELRTHLAEIVAGEQASIRANYQLY